MKQKKGFTLIELLAVIVILAVIALIATPLILGVIDSSKKGATMQSVRGYVEALEQKNIEQELAQQPGFQNGVYSLSELGELSIKGEAPKNACVQFRDGQIVEGLFQFQDGIYEYQQETVTKKNNQTTFTCLNEYVKDGLLLHYDGKTEPVHSKWHNYGSLDMDATLTGSTWNESSLEFNGTTEYAMIGQVNPNMVTVSAYFMISKDNGRDGLVISNFEAGGYGLYYNITSAKDIYFQIYSNETKKYQKFSIVSNCETNHWYHVTGTYDGTKLNTYLDGILVQSNDLVGTIRLPDSQTQLAIAVNPFGSTYNKNTFSPIQVRNLKVYDRALTKEEVKQNFDLDQKRYQS